MDQYIHHLKTKSEHHRRRIALGVSTALTAFIFVLWVSVMAPHSSQVIAKVDTNTSNTTKGESPISTLKTSAAQAFEGMRQVWNTNTSGVNKVDLNTEYSHIKSQVENGDIRMTPDKSQNNNSDNY